MIYPAIADRIHSAMDRRMDESPCAGRNVDLGTLYEEIKDENGTHFKCSMCLRTLSRLQRMEDHLRSIHGIGNRRVDNATLSVHNYTVRCEDDD